MMKGILDEVGEELREQFAIPIDLDVVRDLGPERAPALFGGRGIGFGNRAHHVGEGHRPRCNQLGPIGIGLRLPRFRRSCKPHRSRSAFNG
jgi:hypothetical protein